MSKAKDFKEHADKMIFDLPSGERAATILNDGTLRMHRTQQWEPMYCTGIPPKEALALGRWLVEMYEGSDDPSPEDEKA